ncbi:zinc finger, C6HC-type containing protein [Tanacetum coccineum]
MVILVYQQPLDKIQGLNSTGPFKDCSALLVDDGGEAVTSSECPHCNRLFCAQCKEKSHTDEQYAELDLAPKTKNEDAQTATFMSKEPPVVNTLLAGVDIIFVIYVETCGMEVICVRDLLDRVFIKSYFLLSLLSFARPEVYPEVVSLPSGSSQGRDKGAFFMAIVEVLRCLGVAVWLLIKTTPPHDLIEEVAEQEKEQSTNAGTTTEPKASSAKRSLLSELSSSTKKRKED